MQFREGNSLESTKELILAVKGLPHLSGKVIAFVRYIHHLRGDRKRNGDTYRRISDLDKKAS